MIFLMLENVKREKFFKASHVANFFQTGYSN